MRGWSPGAKIGLLAGLLVLALALLPFVGSHLVSPFELLSGSLETGDRFVLLTLRLPRVLLAAIAGAALSSAGMAFQALFRNPLATPFTLGVSSGAALGAVLAEKLGTGTSFLGYSGMGLLAFAGALGIVLLVYGLARLKGGLSTAHLLLAGVALSFACGSLLMLIQYLADYTQSFRIVRWLMGSLETTGFSKVLGLLVPASLGLSLLFFLRLELDLLTVGEEFARSRGVDTERVKRLLFLGTSLMVGAVVATCGPIGFVGLMVPHMARLWVGAGHGSLLPACLVGGGLFLCVADTAARTVVYPTEIPVGILTALLGGVFFLWLLMKSPGGPWGGAADRTAASPQGPARAARKEGER
jgi:iron complex transport system permease protein